MKQYMEIGEYGVYDRIRYRCMEDKEGNGCDKCDLRSSKITDSEGLTICDVLYCGKSNRRDKKDVYFVKKSTRKKIEGKH